MNSDAFRLLGAPFRGYAELAAQGDALHARALPWRLLGVLGVVATFVSITTAGRIVFAHLGWSVLAWSFLPALQSVALAVALRGVAPDRSRRAAFSLLLLGAAPWLLLLLAIAGVCLLAPDVSAALFALLRSGALPVAMLVALAWGMTLTVAMFRAGFGLSRRTTASCALRYYATLVAMIVAWYIAVGELLPLLGVFP